MNIDVDSPTAFMQMGACQNVDPNIMLPTCAAETPAALAVCAKCAVTEVCKMYAISTGQRHGVWGGMSQRQLQKEVRDYRASI